MRVNILLIVIGTLLTFTSHAQKTDFTITKFSNVKKLSTVNLSTVNDKYLPSLQHVEAPDFSNNSYKSFLEKRKQEIQKKYPKTNKANPSKRSYVNPPTVEKTFSIFNVKLGIPCDNHLAMNGENVVSCGNTYMAIHSPTGSLIKKFTLDQLATAAGITNGPFDPRLAYDAQNERYVLTFLAGNNSNNTDIVVAFSASNDPSGDWNFYTLPGNPNQLDQWTDYPMIALTNNHLYLTINLLKDGETWQAGFIETIIWQMDKNTGYNGEGLGVTRIDGITFEDRNIRNLCPAESATESMYDDVFFVSNRNFAFESDTFFVVKIDPTAGDPSDLVKIDMVRSDKAYGAPPNANQVVGFLQTNDARVLEAFRLDDEIQFVGNTRNLENNMAGIYHGFINDIQSPSAIELHHLIGPDYELGYPGITYTGEAASDRDAIIAFNHTSSTKNPGVSAVYSIPGEGYSPITQIGQGITYVDMLGGSLERWGDYLGTQRDYNDPSTVWVAGFIGIGNKSNAPLIGRLSKPEVPTSSTEVLIEEQPAVLFPNPAQDLTQLEIIIPENSDRIDINLVTSQGRLVDKIYGANAPKSGKNIFSFDTSRIASGMYSVVVLVDGKPLINKKLIKM